MYQNGFFRDPVNFLIMTMNKIEKVVTWNLPKLAQSLMFSFSCFSDQKEEKEEQSTISKKKLAQSDTVKFRR